jgi:hypothetical protein
VRSRKVRKSKLVEGMDGEFVAEIAAEQQARAADEFPFGCRCKAELIK